jgi:hypothetical protein
MVAGRLSNWALIGVVAVESGVSWDADSHRRHCREVQASVWLPPSQLILPAAAHAMNTSTTMWCHTHEHAHAHAHTHKHTLTDPHTEGLKREKQNERQRGGHTDTQKSEDSHENASLDEEVIPQALYLPLWYNPPGDTKCESVKDATTTWLACQSGPEAA